MVLPEHEGIVVVYILYCTCKEESPRLQIGVVRRNDLVLQFLAGYVTKFQECLDILIYHLSLLPNLDLLSCYLSLLRNL